MKKLLLILALFQVDYAELAPREEQPPLPEDAAPVVEVSPPECIPAVIDSYIASGGRQWYVSGMTVTQHLVRDHGFERDQLRGLSQRQLLYLHGWVHNASDDDQERYGVVAHPGRVGAKCRDAVKRDVVTIYSPATWCCRWCEEMKAQDWSDMPFVVRFVKRDGFRSYPRTEWEDKTGKRWFLTGFYSPKRVLWSYRETMK